MQHCTFELDEESSELCAIAPPFGLYKCKQLPVGVSDAPDIAQEVMTQLLKAVEDIEIHIDDIGTFSGDWKSHLQTIDQVLKILEDNGFSVNPLKCKWAARETDFLGHCLTPTSVKPWRKKINSVLKMQSPSAIAQL